MIKLLDGKGFNNEVSKSKWDYDNPVGYIGLGKDIVWCESHKNAGKLCSWCNKKSIKQEWQTDWMWYYLTEWSSSWDRFRCHDRYYMGAGNYSPTGLRPNQLKSLFKKGCGGFKRCRCASLIQRSHWLCPSCIDDTQKITRILNCHLHDIFIAPQEDLKRELLIYRLSGII